MNPLAEPEVVIEGGKPIERQLVTQIERQIRQGILRPGEELPTVRAVAVALAIRPQEVKAAYDRLVREGLLTSGESCGPRVADLPATRRTDDLDQLCGEFLHWAVTRGHSLADVAR